MSAFFEVTRELDSQIALELKFNDSCPPHFHSNLELLYVINGEIDININGQVQTLKKGGVSIANSYDIHAYTNPLDARTFVLIIPTALVRSYTAMLRSKVFMTPFIAESQQTKLIYSILQHLHKTKGAESELFSKGCAYSILGVLLDCSTLIEKPAPRSSDFAREILIYIQENYLTPLTIDHLARHFGYNKDYLSRFFNSYLRCGFNRYLNGIRARHAAYLLENGSTNLTEIAFASGFNNYRTFNRAFKQSFAMSPSKYKKRVSEKKLPCSF